jgi:serine/threonine-protein kinase HipA
MNRTGLVYMHNIFAGEVGENNDGYFFKYDDTYLKENERLAISATLPLTANVYSSKFLFPFFDGLIPEGWLLDIAERNWKIKPNDRMGLLLSCCKDCIGAVSVIENKNEKV